ncbi:hypothetical protein SERLA73DRAFT_188730 [Serpula lacrymans var. lacrymans S7.3]|uniref:Uncharacterized protein n=1 Tax=Serpula lacrymans var. lacrymans (strain S7.3) TaxID=936435 RepID=F8QC24_SERL3|nr:hypothetical protein SERLA73DRAFT_188730 [Serpula lacrymans var. lacrymans S7.3]
MHSRVRAITLRCSPPPPSPSLSSLCIFSSTGSGNFLAGGERKIKELLDSTERRCAEKGGWKRCHGRSRQHLEGRPRLWGVWFVNYLQQYMYIWILV